MYLTELNKQQIETVYNTHMVRDFPKAELKPLRMILDAVDRGIYLCLGLFDGDEQIGISFLEKAGSDHLMDYIAIIPERRNSGAGSEMLRLLAQRLGDEGHAILEVEDPDRASDEAEKELQIRRLGFYKRNGCRDTGLRVECFDVPFVILEAGSRDFDSLDEVWELYRTLYGLVLTEETLARRVLRS